jgi:alpha-ketoglutarate-dependent taurine dioxygenase
MSPPTAVDIPKLIFNDKKDKFKAAKKNYEGPSPHAEKSSEASQVTFKGTLETSGKLDSKYKFEEETPVIGRIYKDAQLADILDDDELVRDLAITISRRGVVFFRNQNITPEQQKLLANKLGRLTGKPKESGLHIHPITPRGGFAKADAEDEIDPEISLITSKFQRQGLQDKKLPKLYERKPGGWHSDITFEPVPSDYAILKIVQTPETGGDTLWASGYAAYDSLSDPLKGFLESLTGTYAQPGFKKSSEDENFDFFTGPRGNPENVGDDLIAHHPLIRTNPVTGWNSIFALGEHYTSIDGLSHSESELITKLIQDIVFRRHDIRVRYKWSPNDVALWDNRSVYHTATPDIYEYDDGTERHGVRTVSIGERPFLDAKGKSRAADLKEKGLKV